MKAERIVARFLVVAAAVAAVAACSISGPEVSIEERIDDFEKDLRNDNWESLYEHIHPDNDKRGEVRGEREYWESVFDGPDYRFTGVSSSGETRNVDVENNNDSTEEHPAEDVWRFEMKEDKDGPLSRGTWYVDGITSDGGPDPLP
ncbi:MAG: hypothetical protein ACLFUM_10655 [Spirochaetaceae bacterium]